MWPKMTHVMLMVRMPLIHVMADEATSVLNICLKFFLNEKHKRMSANKLPEKNQR